MGGQLFCTILFMCFINFLYATGSLYEYAKTQVEEITSDISCINEDNHVSCKAENIEWVDGIFAEKMHYDFTLKNGILTKVRAFKLQAQDLNFEGYNLATFVPETLLCTDKIFFIQAIERALHGESNVIQVLTECTLKSKSYHLVLNANFITSHPIYKGAKDVLEALRAEHKRFIQPLNETQENTWKREYQIYPKSLALWLTSHSLNDDLFALYKRERRIATNATPQNDTNYRVTNDSVLSQEYKKFLQQSYSILQSLMQQGNITQSNQKALQDALDVLIKTATTSNQTLSITLAGDKNFSLSLEELDELTNIDTGFLRIIGKILKNTTALVAK